MMRYATQLLRLVLAAAGGFLLFLLMFSHGLASSVGILFYRGIILAAASALAIGILAAWLARRRDDASLPIAAAAVSFSLNICFLVLLPVTVDRSVTVSLLSTVESRQPAGISPDTLERSFVPNYVVRLRAVPRRIDEQVKSGNLEVGSDGKLRLTRQGEEFMRLARTVARLFGTDPRFVNAPPALEQGRETATRSRGKKG